MAHLKLTDRADLQVFYAADKLRYSVEQIAEWGITLQHFIAHYENMPSLGYEIDGACAGGAIFDGTELHIAVLPQYHGRWAWLFKPTLDWLFAMRDPVQVKIEIQNTLCINFLDAARLPRVAQNDQFITFLLSTQNNDIFRRHRDRMARDLDNRSAAPAHA